MNWTLRSGVPFLSLLAIALLVLPQQANGQQGDCDNIPTSIGPVPTWVASCSKAMNAKIQGVASTTSTAFGWEGGSDRLNSLVLGTPEVLTNLGGMDFGPFVAGCDFAGNDGSVIYCIDSGEPTATLFTVATDGSGIRTLVGHPVPSPTEMFTSLSWDPTTSTMYATSTNQIESSLYTIDIVTGTATHIGFLTAIAFSCTIASGIDNAGNLFTYDICDNFMYSVNKTTGHMLTHSIILP